MPTNGPETFANFSPLHLTALAAIAGVAWWLAARRRRLRLTADPEGARMDVQLSVVLLVVWILEQAIEFLPARFSIHESLPFHICDVTALVAPFAVRAVRRWPRAMLYYWGLALSSQAVLQPDLTQGPARAAFWVFWIPHGGIMVAAVYDLVGRAYRPTWPDYGWVCATLAVYVAAVLPIDLWLGVDYGFVGDVAGGPIDFLGPWPLRVYKAATAVAFTLALMTAAWPVARRLRGGRERRGFSIEPVPVEPVREAALPPSDL